MTRSNAKSLVVDPFMELASDTAAAKLDDFFKKRKDPVASFEDSFSKDLLDGRDLFAKNSAFREASESNHYEADHSEAAYNVSECSGAGAGGVAKPLRARASRFAQGRRSSTVNVNNSKRAKSRGRIRATRVRRLCVEPTADTARPETQAVKATASVEQSSHGMTPLKVQCDSATGHQECKEKAKTRATKVVGSSTSAQINEHTVAEKSKSVNEADKRSNRSKSTGRSTRIRNTVTSRTKDLKAGRSPPLPKMAPQEEHALCKSMHSIKTQRAGLVLPFKKASSESTLKEALSPASNDKTAKGKPISKSTGSQRSDRKKSNSSDTSNTTHEMSSSTDGRSSSSFAAVEIVDESDDESSVEDLWVSPPPRRKKAVSIPTVKKGVHNHASRVPIASLHVDVRHPQEKVDCLSARTDHHRRNTSQSSLCNDYGNLSDSNIGQDSRPRAPARKTSKEFGDFMKMRQSLATDRDQIPRKPVAQRDGARTPCSTCKAA
ncbi:hypothetical protein MPSEU_000356200 [Mayamaea pseudoterrestris]|nr:hypothetical protein MPSEU_000356200 [Mayamaea pseudoterrestris]